MAQKQAFTVQAIQQVYSKKGYTWRTHYSDYPMTINLGGIRSPQRVANKFDDFIFMSVVTTPEDQTISQPQESLYLWPATTDPGLFWLGNPPSPHGTAILVPDQYTDVYSIDKHRGKYDALCQRLGPVYVYRDSNKDHLLDFDPQTVMKGYFGINIHRSHPLVPPDVVSKYSAGCQVFVDPNDYSMFMSFCYRSAEIYGNTFTYTLLESKDFS